MCGIVGVAGDLSEPDQRLFDTLLYLDALRGWDSTGLATVNPLAGETTIMKGAVPAADFMSSPDYDKTRKTTDVLWLGHNRAATIGGVEDDLAHPFEYGTVIGVHNGTVHDWRSLAGGDKRIKMDSQALIKSIDDHGIEDTLRRAKHGAYALVWYDKQDHKLKFVRNSQRPLSFAFSHDKKAMWFASDPKMFFMARQSDRQARRISISRIENQERFVETTPGTLYQLQLPDNYSTRFKEEDFERIELDLSAKTIHYIAKPLSKKERKKLAKKGGSGNNGQDNFQQQSPKLLSGPGVRPEYVGPKSPITKPQVSEEVESEAAAGAAEGSATTHAGKRTTDEERKAKLGARVLAMWDKKSEARYWNDIYLDFLSNNVMYDILDDKGKPKDVQDVKVWRASVQEQLVAAERQKKAAQKVVYNQGLSVKTARAVVNAEAQAQLARDLLAVGDHSFWGWYCTEDKDGNLPVNPKEKVKGLAPERNVDAPVSKPDSEPETGKKSHGSLSKQQSLEQFASQNACLSCKKHDPHPDVLDTWLNFNDKGEITGIVCSTCMKDPLISNYVKDGGFANHG